jgi:septum formation protein
MPRGRSPSPAAMRVCPPAVRPVFPRTARRCPAAVGVPGMTPLILASGSATRAELLRRAGLAFEVVTARIDEQGLRASLTAEGAAPRDIADHLAAAKARKVSLRRPDALVLGCDQLLVAEDGRLLAKPASREAAANQLRDLRGRTHALVTAAVLCHGGADIWRHVDEARMTMRDFDDAYLEAYLARAWPAIADSVGGYRIEEEGVRLFRRIDGSFFTVLGLPLLPLLNFLADRGDIVA